MKITSPSVILPRKALHPGKRGLLQFALLVALAPGLFAAKAETPTFAGEMMRGKLVPAATVNVGEVAKTPESGEISTAGPEVVKEADDDLLPPMAHTGRVISPRMPSTPRAAAARLSAPLNFRGFTGLSHLDQRNARNGNQFSIEPPDQALAVGNGFVLEAVNEGLNIYSTGGFQLLPRPLALTEFFGTSAAINRSTGRFGFGFTDPVALYDSETQRWFVLAFTQLNDTSGNPRPQSRIYLAVSSTSDPRGAYTIYILDSTFANDSDGRGPRIPDYPHIGIDRFGFYINANEFGAISRSFIGGAIFAISKQALVSGGSPTVTRFKLPFRTGYEFTVIPANTPPGATPFLNQNGAEFFVSSRFVNDTETSLGVWALVNTRSLNDPTPSLQLQLMPVDTQAYNFPSQPSEQKEGFRPLGAAVNGALPKISSGDFRVQTVVYGADRLWATLGTEVTDENGDKRMAAAYFSFDPDFKNGFVNPRLDTQGVISETGANLLRPAIALNARKKGAIVFTLVGPNDFPSSAFVPVDKTETGPIQIARAGNEPEDGFTGYAAFGSNGTARWGDYSAAAVDGDGSIWMATEYTPDINRTSFANWSTYITRFAP